MLIHAPSADANERLCEPLAHLEASFGRGDKPVDLVTRMDDYRIRSAQVSFADQGTGSSRKVNAKVSNVVKVLVGVSPSRAPIP